MSAHQIDHGTAAVIGTTAIIGTTESDSQPWMRILFSYPGACFITGEQAIRNLRAACDAALEQKGEEK